MKKIIALAIALVSVLSMVGCARTMNDVIGKEPEFVGVVIEVMDDSIVVNVDSSEAEYDNCPVVMVPLDVEISDSYLDCSVGDEVVVYYDGNIIGGEPAMVEKVYAITLKTPADRTENDES